MVRDAEKRHRWRWRCSTKEQAVEISSSRGGEKTLVKVDKQWKWPETESDFGAGSTGPPLPTAIIGTMSHF